VLELVGRRARVVMMPNAIVRSMSRVALKSGIPLPFNPYVALYATRYWFVDNTKARRELGLDFRDARSTLGDTITWLRQAGHLN